ncbi:hypothetical protein [Streptomyces sp. NPDC001717]
MRPTVSATRKILFSASFFAILLVPCGVSPRYAAASPAVAPPRSYVWIAQ